MDQQQFDTFVQENQGDLRVSTVEAVARDLGLAFYVEDVPVNQMRYPGVETEAIQTVKLTLKWLREGGADKREINSRAVIAASYALAIASGNSLVTEMP